MKSNLKVSTPNDREILMTREFHAPRQLVWDAHTKCELLKKWLFGPDGWALSVCEMDLRVGGKYRWVWSHPQKKSMATGGVFREIAAPEKLVNTEQFEEPWYPGEALNTMVLTEQAGKTLLTWTLRYESKEGRDIALKSGMETGMEMGYERLDKIFASMAAAGGAK